MHRAWRILVAVLVVCLAGAPLAPALAQGEGEIRLVPFSNETFGIQGVVPEGWAEAAPGVYRRGASAADLATLIQQAAPGMTVDGLAGVLLPQLGLEALPESVGSMETAAFTWTLYVVEVQAGGLTVMVDLALAESEAGATIVLLQASDADYEALHEAVFLPAVEALAPLGAEAGGEAEGEALYEDPAGLFTVPIPTNWQAEAAEGYGILRDPEGAITVYALAVEAEDVEAGLAEAWARVKEDFDLEIQDVTEIPASGGVEQIVVITYESGDEGRVVQGFGQLYEGVVYALLFDAELDAAARRNAQIQIIASGLQIAALEETDLSGVEPLPLTDELIAELEAYIEEAMATYDVPGAAVAVVRDGEVVYRGGFGVRELGGEEPVTPETLMMIGSTTKTMTTLLMATLVDEGVMAWDTPVVEILPSFRVADPAVTAQITMQHMVCACTGVPRRDFELFFNSYSAEEIVESLATFEFFTDFGEAFQYSNQMVAAAGYLAALAAGGEYGTLYEDYVALMQERVFDPIGMTATTFSFDRALAGEHATPHGQTLSGEYQVLPLEYERFVTPVAPAGAAWSNVVDMARYLIMELNRGVAADGTRVVSAENLEHTWEPQVPISAEASYGLGWIVEEYKGVRVLSHGGNTLGFTSELAFLPEVGLGISVLSNQQGSIFNQAVRYRLLELLYQQEPEFEAQARFAIETGEEALAELQGQIQDSVDPEAVAPYLGRYRNEALGEVTLSLEEGALLLDAGEFQAEVRPRVSEEGEVSYLTYSFPLAGLPLKLEEDAEGNPTLVLGASVNEYTFTKVE